MWGRLAPRDPLNRAARQRRFSVRKIEQERSLIQRNSPGRFLSLECDSRPPAALLGDKVRHRDAYDIANPDVGARGGCNVCGRISRVGKISVWRGRGNAGQLSTSSQRDSAGKFEMRNLRSVCLQISCSLSLRDGALPITCASPERLRRTMVQFMKG